MTRGARTPLQEAFGRAVIRLRKKKKISQEKLAQLAGINRTYMGDVERGERNLALQNMAKIAQALGVKLSQIIREMEREITSGRARPRGPGH